jgi:hypothetical protein
MKHLVEFPLEDGTTILVEVDDPETGSVVRSGRAGDAVAKSQKTFEEAMDKVKPAASAIIAKIRSLHDAPDEVEVEFGLKMSADVGAFVASAGVEANYKVTLKWKKEEKPA